MNAIRAVVARAYDALFPLVPIAKLPADEIRKMSDEQIAEYNLKAAAFLDRKEREQAAVRRELEAEERNMRRGTG
jgi:hypothetical protein